MDRRFFLGAAAAAMVGLAGCSEVSFGEPVELTQMVHIDQTNAPNMVGVWTGTFTPMYEGRGEGGEVTLDVTEVDGTLLRSVMTWSRNGQLWQQQRITSALAPAGHWNFMSTHAMLHRKGQEHFLLADIVMNDGNWYTHRLARTDVDFGEGHYH